VYRECFLKKWNNVTPPGFLNHCTKILPSSCHPFGISEKASYQKGKLNLSGAEDVIRILADGINLGHLYHTPSGQ
jgi:hypothetical protein